MTCGHPPAARLAEALQLPENAFDQLYGDKPNEHIKLIRYPGQQETQSSGRRRP